MNPECGCSPPSHHGSQCPNHEVALLNLREALSDLEISEEVELIHVETEDAAKEHKFLGSPSIRIGSVDLEDSGSGTYSMQCRRYQDGHRVVGYPSRSMIVEKLRAHMMKSGGVN